MSNKSGVADNIISLPSGGGAQKGMGEKFSADLFTGTGNFSVPIAVPPGRNGFQPQLTLGYSTGSGNGPFGLGWNLSVPGVVRKTSKGIPRYDDERDVFILSGAEDLIQIKKTVTTAAGVTTTKRQYRPRTEGLFARITMVHVSSGLSYWEVKSKDGLTSYYGSDTLASNDTAKIHDPDDTSKVFAWKLTKTVDLFGNTILYSYTKDSINEDGPHRWDQNYLSTIQYMDYDDSGTTRYLCKVQFNYEQRPDPMSDYSGGFEVRTVQRCIQVVSYTYPSLTETKVKTYQLNYLDALAENDPALIAELPINGASMLKSIQVIGHDGSQTETMPPLQFSYSLFQPLQRNFKPVEGPDLPWGSLSNPQFELADVFGNGLPDIVQLDGVPRYWRNLGNGRFDRPKSFKDAPGGFTLADPDVQLVDAQGDGMPDLLINKGGINGYFPLRFGGEWDRKSFVKNRFAPSFSYADPEVKMMDMTGDGITDVVRNGSRLELFYFDEKEGFGETATILKKDIQSFPNLSFSDPRIKTASMVGGLQDVVRIENGSITYWPNMGYGKFGAPIAMKNSPRFPQGFNPQRLLLGDLDGDGYADLAYIENNRVLLCINQSGNSWSDPIEIMGTPAVTDMDAVRIVDLLGNGVPCILWTRDAVVSRKHQYLYLDVVGGIKPYVMNEMNNNMGAITRVEYKPSTHFYLRDEQGISVEAATTGLGAAPGGLEQRHRTRWKTHLPFPTQCLAKTEVIDELSRGKLVTQYHYHNGYWDGGEREFRGFAHVDQVDTETFQEYNNDSLAVSSSFLTGSGSSENNSQHTEVKQTHYSPPTMTKHWFHLGPVGDEFGEWEELNLTHEYWDGDLNMLSRPLSMQNMIKTLPRRARRDAYRTLRGSTLRTELYALDGSSRQSRPYTVTESLQGVRLEFSPDIKTPQGPGLLASDPFTAFGSSHPQEQSVSKGRELKHSGHIFFSFGLASRTTQWERGVEPLHSFGFTEAYNDYGQAEAQISIATPRGKNPLLASGTGEPYLATSSKTTYIHKDITTHFICDRSSESKSWEIINSGTGSVFTLRENILNGSATKKLLSHVLNYFDGTAFEGLALGTIGDYGAISKVKRLVMTTANVTDTYGSTPAYLQASPTWGSEYPSYVQSNVPALLGFELESSTPFEAGYYTLAERKKYDFQVGSSTNLGLVHEVKGPMGVVASVTYDSYQLMPLTVTDAQGLVTTAAYDYRVMQANLVTDANENQTAFAFSPLGLLYKTAQMGKAAVSEGDDLDHPSVTMEYDFHAFVNGGDPVWVKTTQQEEHYYPSETVSDTIVSIEFTDGFGRLLQSRAQAEDVIYGSSLFGDSALPADQSATNQNAVGEQVATSGNNVVVSGWKVYDNKGRVVEAYEPFYDTGYDYKSPEEITGYFTAGSGAKKVRSFYDPLGRAVKSLNPDGTQQRIVFGVPATLSTPPNPADPASGGFAPTPWERYTYDANDLAPITHPTGSGVPASHHYTAKSEVIDALGRVVSTTEHKVQDVGGSSFEDVVMTYEYDIQGRLTRVKDAYNRDVFVYTHPTSPLLTGDDAPPTPLKTVHIDAGVGTAIYNAGGQPIEARDAKGSVHITMYDLMNRPRFIYARDHAGQDIIGVEQMRYGTNTTAFKNLNKAGKLYQHYNQSGFTSFYHFDFKGNLYRKLFHLAKDSVILDSFTGPPTNWEVEPLRIDWSTTSGIHEAQREVRYFYDALNRVTRIRHPQNVLGSTDSQRFYYNKAGALTQVRYNSDYYVNEIAYNAKGQRVLIAYGNDQMTRYAYDSNNFRLLRQKTERYVKSTSGSTHTYTPQAGTTRQDTGYEYDLAGNILKTKERSSDCGINGSALGVDALDRQFTYDPLNRLLSATGREMDNYADSDLWFAPNHPSPGNPNADHTQAYTRTYQYDKLGNIEQLRSTGTNSFTRAFNYPTTGSTKDHNRQTSIDIGAATHDFTYDAQGNMLTNTGNRYYKWNYLGQLIAFYIQDGTNEPSVYAQYFYDGSGNRVKKLVRNAGGAYESTTYMDGVMEYRTDGTLEQNTIHISDDGSRIANLVLGDAFSGDLTETSWYVISDHNGCGSLRLNAHAGGTVIDREEYYPFGDSSLRTVGKKRYRYVGKERDAESGLYYYGARYYAAWTCRFISVDPLAMEYPFYTPYNYAGNKPVNRIDIDGMQEGNKTTEGGTSENTPKLYHNTENGDKILEEGFNASKHGERSKYNWFTTETDDGSTGRSNSSGTLTVENIDVSKAELITKEQTKAWSAEAMKEMGYTKDSWKEAMKNLPAEKAAELAKERTGRMWSKVGQYMDEMGHDIYKIEKNGHFAVSDKIANTGKITQVSGRAAKNWVKNLNGKKIAGRSLLFVGLAMDVYEIYTSNDKLKATTKVVYGWAGAEIGAAIAGGGALIGGQLGPQVLIPEEIITVPIASLIGGAIGYFIGSETGEILYETIQVVTKGWQPVTSP